MLRVTTDRLACVLRAVAAGSRPPMLRIVMARPPGCMFRRLAPLLAPLALLAPPAAVTVPAQQPDAAASGLSFDATGYLRSLTGFHDAGFEPPGADRRTVFNGESGRLMWSVAWGDRITLNVHNRLLARVSFSDAGFGPEVAGLGVSVVPGRSADLSTVLVDRERVRLVHDVDRLAATIETDAADVTVGRQAITWGLAALFPVADLWAQFSPFELDAEEKPGIDAVRVLAYPRRGIELDAVVADRGSWEHLSAGARATVELASADVYAGVGKFWDRVIALGGMARVLEQTTLRAEAALPWHIDDRRFDAPRATLGIDRLGPRLTLTAEYHFNGIGANDADGYVVRLADPRIRRGETYFLGRHYLGGLAAWRPGADGRLNITLSALANLRDPSVALTPLASYDLGRNARVSLGTLQSFGSRPASSFPPLPHSEFGSYGTLWFATAAVFF